MGFTRTIPLQVRRPKDLLVMLRTKEKYIPHTPSCILPVCIESLGAWSESTKSFIHQNGPNVRDATGEIIAINCIPHPTIDA